MRIMDDLIHEHGLDEELEDRLVEAMGNTNLWLGPDPEHMDEPSDAEDPEEQLRATVDGLRAEASDRQAMVHAVQGALECREARLDLERARMHLEDARSRPILAEMP